MKIQTKIGDIVKLGQGNGKPKKAIITSEPYIKDWSAHSGLPKGTKLMEMIKVKRWIKSRNDWATKDAEYHTWCILEVIQSK